jgi:Lipid A 3-O-deacylase (PagL)
MSSLYSLGAVLLVLASPTPARAQAAALTRGSTEWSVAAGVAQGISLLQSGGGQRYAMPSVSWGRVLTDPRGPRWMRGRFEWLVELSPFFVEWEEGHARGAGVVPLAWRWNFERGGTVVPFTEVGGGALWTTTAVPAGTSSTNFTTYAGAGLRLLGPAGRGMIIGYRLHHISNGNRVTRNPGVNAHMLVVGWTGVSSR